MKPERQVHIRPATDQDASTLLDLVHELGYERSRAQITETLGRISRNQGRTDLLLLADSDELGICGFLQAHASTVLESGFRVEIVGLLVAERARRLGIASALVAKAEAWARELGAEVLVVRSNETRVESHIFYPKLGFAVAKKQVVYRKRIENKS